jgi:hypothetical protein
VFLRSGALLALLAGRPGAGDSEGPAGGGEGRAAHDTGVVAGRGVQQRGVQAAERGADPGPPGGARGLDPGQQPGQPVIQRGRRGERRPVSAETSWRRGQAMTSAAASARTGVISGATSIAPITTAAESSARPSAAMKVDKTISTAKRRR